MSKSTAPAKLPKGTVAVPAAAIGAMSMVLAVGFQSVGLNARVDAGLIIMLGALPVLIVVFWRGLCAVTYAGRLWISCEGSNAEVRRRSKMC